MDASWIGYALAAGGAVGQIGSIGLVAFRLRRRVRPKRIAHAPKVTLLRPVCGFENYIEDELETSFRLTYPNIELIFCVDDESDPVVPIVRHLIAAYPRAEARLLIGRDAVTPNPKLNNLWKGWQAATADWIILSDSNALLPPDYVESLFARWDRKTGVVSHATVSVLPEGFVAELECAFMNAYQARIVLAADTIGFGYALGKTLMWHRDTIAAAGGYQAMAQEAAEDISTTRSLRPTGLRARLATRPLPQAIGRRRWKDVWRRQVRWAQVRRSGLRGAYLAEPLSGGLLPIGAMVVLVATGVAPAWSLAAYVVAWYGLEAALSSYSGWPLTWRIPLASVLRDLLIPVIWLVGWGGRQFDWRGTAISLKPDRKRSGRPG